MSPIPVCVRLNKKRSFDDIPPEIHLMIWEYCMPPARTIRLGFPQDPENRLQDRSIPDNVHDLAPPQLPVLLHINHSSRAFALSHMVLGFGHTPSALDKTYWNPKLDTLYIPPFNPKEETSTFHFNFYRIADPLERTIEGKLWQAWLRPYRFRMLALDRIQHLALCFPDNSLNESLGDDDEDMYARNGILYPRKSREGLCPSMGELNWGIDERIAKCGNLKTLTWVGDNSLFSGASKWGTPSIREISPGEKVDKKLLGQGRVFDFVTGQQKVLIYNSQFLRSFESYIEETVLNSKTTKDWEMPRLAVGSLEFEKGRILNDFCVEPAGRKEGDKETVGEKEETREDDEDYDSNYLSDDSIV